ncbi:ABC transporter permease [Glycomyces sp. NRRL B-16210]|uniref:ABC transporter permease n=1 Tax=Glycomyces sp. NRRL B-16210 TaxID=1463821 RepID=UPI0004BFEE03|nr:ABC-2 family transporter protein [Glycomyces sp. NRRL B-16210]
MAADTVEKTGEIRHAGGVYRRSIGAYLRSIAEYPADFWVMAVSGTFWQIMLFAFLSILFANVNAIVGWGYHEMLVLAGFLAVAWSSTQLFWDGIWDVGKMIVEGDMDYRLTRPAPVLVQVASKHVGMQVFGEMTLGLVMLVFGWTGAGIGLAMIPVALLLLVCAAVIQASLLTAANAANFWMKGRMPVLAFALAELQNEAMRFPLTVFPAAVRLVLTFGLPLAFASFIPVQILTGRLDWWWLLAPPLAAAATAAIAAWIFRQGVKAYDSAGH